MNPVLYKPFRRGCLGMGKLAGPGNPAERGGTTLATLGARAALCLPVSPAATESGRRSAPSCLPAQANPALAPHLRRLAGPGQTADHRLGDRPSSPDPTPCHGRSTTPRHLEGLGSGRYPGRFSVTSSAAGMGDVQASAGSPQESQISHQVIYSTYRRAAEARLQRQAYPPVLRAYVREYFTFLAS